MNSGKPSVIQYFKLRDLRPQPVCAICCLEAFTTMLSAPSIARRLAEMAYMKYLFKGESSRIWEHTGYKANLIIALLIRDISEF
jgi:hypothetical protein